MVGPVSLNAAISTQRAPTSAPVSRRSRRSWSDDEKRRIIAEALVPGASVAEIARRHGVNANLVFNWRRTARTACSVGAEMAAPSEPARSDAMLTASDPGFIPLGVFTRAPDGGPALIAGGGVAEQLPSPTARARANVEGRTGLIEIDLADGTRLRVDGFVNERALRHVLSALRATA
jgi:transposase